jgi:hypothetical protein
VLPCQERGHPARQSVLQARLSNEAPRLNVVCKVSLHSRSRAQGGQDARAPGGGNRLISSRKSV